MSSQRFNKLKHLYNILPEEVVAPSAWLAKEGYSPQLLRRYLESGVLKRLGRGVYTRTETDPTFEGLMVGVQRLAKLPFHGGGVSALQMRGFAHYLPFGEARHDLYGPKNPPAWLKNLERHFDLVFHKKPRFGDLALEERPSGIRDYTITISAPERAILELLYDVERDGVSFTYAAELFENLSSLRPRVVRSLLEKCESVRVRRLFLYLATTYRHPWMKYLKMDDIDIGRGKMRIVEHGRLDRRFLITVPEGMPRA